MAPPLADTVMPGGGFVVGVGLLNTMQPPLRGVLIVALTLVILTMGFAPVVPPE